MGLIRGTTPTLEFILPFDTSQLAEAFVTIAQQGAIKVDKPLSECRCDENTITLQLTQEDTLKLESGCLAEIQIRARTTSGEAIASSIIRVGADRILKEGVI